MVSHAEIADRSSRRAPSVSSRSRSLSKHHHRGHSHHGGSSHVPQNEFPFFTHTGDVEIVIAANGLEKRYLLHRLILAQCSGFFEAGTSEEWSRNRAMQDLPNHEPRNDRALTVIGEDPEIAPATPDITPAQITRAPSGRKRWRYELDWENAEDNEEPMLVQRTPNSSGLFAPEFVPIPPPQRPKPPPTQHSSFFRSMANLTLGSHHHAQSTTHLPPIPPQVDTALLCPVIRDYDNLFRIFYNHPPNLNASNIASAYSECKALLALADMYDALPVVGSRVDHHLLRFSSRLFKQIAKYPPSYLKLGYLARSRIIFSEALTHVVGQWPQPYPYLKEQGYAVPDSVIDLIEDKVDELEEIQAKVDIKLFRLTLTTSRGDRVTPSNDYLGWLAMSLFRQWLAVNTTPPPAGILKNNTPPRAGPAANQPNLLPPGAAPPTLPPPSIPPLVVSNSSARIYRQISALDPQTYLGHDDLKRFLKLSGDSRSSSGLYTRDNLRRFERKMDEIKNIAHDIVKPLTRCCLEAGVPGGTNGNGGGGLGYLVCMRVEEGELPWD